MGRWSLRPGSASGLQRRRIGDLIRRRQLEIERLAVVVQLDDERSLHRHRGAGLLCVDIDRELADPLLAVDPDLERDLGEPGLLHALVEPAEALSLCSRYELLELRGVD